MFSNYCKFMYIYYFKENQKISSIEEYKTNNPMVAKRLRRELEEMMIRQAEDFGRKLLVANDTIDQISEELKSAREELEQKEEDWITKSEKYERILKVLKSESRPSFLAIINSKINTIHFWVTLILIFVILININKINDKGKLNYQILF